MAPQPSQTELDRRALILDDLIRSHGRELRAQAAVNSTRKGHIDDALADASVAFLRFYKGPAGVDALRYLMVCVRTAAWEIDRRQRRIEEHDIDRFMPEEAQRRRIARVLDPGGEPGERYERMEAVQERKDLLAQLKPDERTAITMFAYGFSYVEICDRQGWTYTKVNRCMAEGRQRLRQLLSAQEGRS
jgi:DNA-directed RNA polymerase specialized sigma24 family protein